MIIQAYGVRIKEVDKEENIEMGSVLGDQNYEVRKMEESHDSDGEKEEKELFRRRSSRRLSTRKLKRQKSGFEYQDEEENNAFVRLIEISQTKLMLFYLRNKQTIFLTMNIIILLAYIVYLVFAFRYQVSINRSTLIK